MDFHTESDYVNHYCSQWNGQAEYSKITGKAPTVALICKKSEHRFVNRVLVAAPEIEIIIIPNEPTELTPSYFDQKSLERYHSPEYQE
jgi:hypothetical protein